MEWKDAQEDRDGKALAEFTCALPAPPSSKPPTWERGVQRFFQEEVWDKLSELREADARLRIAEDVQGIAAAYTHHHFDSQSPEYDPPTGWGSRLIGYLGIANRHRHKGGAFADQVLTDALYEALEVESEYQHGIYAWGKVHRKNRGSKNMLTRNGFRYRVSIPDDGPLEHWYVQIPR
ncbi:hypothetical protein AB0N60_22295 [Streptomyces microflavus]|uniref:hypothetical protein n=1 Tax=Streptomyces microflavus TaxID=1919 RepID=UPI003419D5A5